MNCRKIQGHRKRSLKNACNIFQQRNKLVKKVMRTYMEWIKFFNVHDSGCACREESACLHRLTAAWLWLRQRGPMSVVKHTLSTHPHTHLHTLHHPVRAKRRGLHLFACQQCNYEDWGGVRWQGALQICKNTDKIPLSQALQVQVLQQSFLGAISITLWMVVQ